MENEDRTDNIVVMIEGEFANSQVKEIASGEMISRLKEKGYKYIDIDRALVSAERRKIIRLQFGLYKWIDPSDRKARKAETERRFRVITEIFKNENQKFLLKGDVQLALRDRGFTDEEINEILREAERDYILHFCNDSLGTSSKVIDECEWVPPRDREDMERIDRYDRDIEWRRQKEVGDEATRRCVGRRDLARELRVLARTGQMAEDSPITDEGELEQIVVEIYDEHDALCLPRKHLLQHLALKLKIRTATAEKLAKMLWRRYVIMLTGTNVKEGGYFEWTPKSERHQLWHFERDELSAQMEDVAKRRWEKEAKKRAGMKFTFKVDWDVKTRVYYRVIATYRIKEFLLSLLRKEWNPKGEEYRNVKKANWSMQTMDLKDINLDQELLKDEKFLGEVKERIDFQKNRITQNELIMPLVVMYENKMLMDGYARFFALRELGIGRARVYYGELIS